MACRLEASPVGAEASHDAVGGGKAERRAARERQCVRSLHGLVGREEISLPGAGRASHDVNASDHRGVADDDRHSRLDEVILRLAYGKAGNVGEQVPWSRPHLPLPLPCRSFRRLRQAGTDR